MAEAVNASQALGHERSEKPHANKPSVGHPQEQNTTALAAAMVSCVGCPSGSEPHAKPRPPANPNSLRDTDSISSSAKGHTVEKRFTIDHGKPVRIYDPTTKKKYDYVRVAASMKKGFVFTYGNDPQ